MSQTLDVAIEAARAAGAVLQEGRQRKLEICEKDASRTSIVTEADLRSQEAIVRVIRGVYPEDAVIGEEGTEGDKGADSVWFVDPLDGTTNYSHGLPFYCVSIAHCDAQGVAHGVIYDPFHENLFVAARGGGATHNGYPVAVSSTLELRTSLLSTQVQSDDPIMLDRYASRSRRFVAAARAVRALGAPALALAYVACGWLDAFCEPDMNPWDTLAGTLLIQEAGGRVTTFTGTTRPLAERTDILGSNGLLHMKVLSLLEPEAGFTAGTKNKTGTI